jgi:anti-sigma B factor antagonist
MAGQGVRVEISDLGNGVTKATLRDSKLLDEKHIQLVGSELFSVVDDGGRRKVLVTLERVEFAASPLFRTLPTLHRKLEAVGGKLVICGMQKDIRHISRASGLDRLVIIKDTNEQALAELGRGHE